MENPRRNSQKNGYGTTIWAAKIAFCFIGILSFCAAVPVAAGALASALPGFWESLRSWLGRPYLFIAVHFIILVIWKLSDQKQQQHQHHREEWVVEEHMTDSGSRAKVESFNHSHTAPLLRKPTLEIWPSATKVGVPSVDPGESSTSEASCITTESGERSTASSAFMAEKSAEPESKSSIMVTEEEAEAVAAATVAGLANASVEATWKAIAQKSSRTAAVPPAAAKSRQHARQPEPPPSSTGHDDLNRRFDDFIKKNHEQIRLLNSRRR
ncbi:hypothetical protein OPV22_032311 [Ensete ventricosum]|uniref:DUF4408 domain-containing protein n=1 Tax=Ensete ventricosum TaxID=4639 RepID=A0AAV8P146_ENSVE|nr:hypothetical protein OPV22_032311 [Ensete ventricosum]